MQEVDYELKVLMALALQPARAYTYPRPRNEELLRFLGLATRYESHVFAALKSLVKVGHVERSITQGVRTRSSYSRQAVKSADRVTLRITDAGLRRVVLTIESGIDT